MRQGCGFTDGAAPRTWAYWCLEKCGAVLNGITQDRKTEVSHPDSVSYNERGSLNEEAGLSHSLSLNIQNVFFKTPNQHWFIQTFSDTSKYHSNAEFMNPVTLGETHLIK